jgi:hypothetical protein
MIDLHTHSIFSDGTDTPESMALMANMVGLKALALTDHDTVDGLGRFMSMQPLVTTVLIPGIELSCRFMGHTLHIVGLFVDFMDTQLINRTRCIQLKRLERNRLIVERLQSRGILIKWDDVVAEAPADLISRVHIAKALVSHGAARNYTDAFSRFIGDSSPCFVPFLELSPCDAVRWIRDAGGIAIVAHPGRGFYKGFLWNNAMLELKRIGIQGLEAYYSSYGLAEHKYFLQLAIDLDLIPCGGSDYHGTNKPHISLGVGNGDLSIPDEILSLLQSIRMLNSNGN